MIFPNEEDEYQILKKEKQVKSLKKWEDIKRMMSDFRLPKLNPITQTQTKKHINTNTTNFIKEFNDFNDKNLDPGV